MPPVSALPSFRGLPRVYWYLWAGTLINRMGGFVGPFLALYLTQERGLSIEDAGLVVSLYGIGIFSAGVIGGFLSDRIGRRATMVMGLCVGPIFMLALCFARAPLHIAGATLLLGLFGDLYRPAVNAALADLVPPKDRTRAYGLLYWAINLGFAIAPVLASAFVGRNFEILFFGDAATSLAFGLLVWARIPETKPEAPEGKKGRSPVSDILVPFRDGVFMGFAAITLLTALVFQQSMSTLPLDVRSHGIPAADFGPLIALNGVLIVLVQPFATSFVERYPRSQVLAASSLLMGIGFGLPMIAQTVPAYALSILIWTLGEIGMAPITPTIVADLAPTSHRGSYQGVIQMSWGASAMLAPVLGSRVLGRFGGPWLWASCLAVASLGALGHLALAGPRRRRLARLRASADSSPPT